jgi:hypothetical protein
MIVRINMVTRAVVDAKQRLYQRTLTSGGRRSDDPISPVPDGGDPS